MHSFLFLLLFCMANMLTNFSSLKPCLLDSYNNLTLWEKKQGWQSRDGILKAESFQAPIRCVCVCGFFFSLLCSCSCSYKQAYQCTADLSCRAQSPLSATLMIQVYTHHPPSKSVYLISFSSEEQFHLNGPVSETRRLAQYPMFVTCSLL